MASTTRSSILPLLRDYAPRLTRHFFSCKPCPNSIHSKASRRYASARTKPETSRYRSTKQTPFLKAFRSQSTAAHLVEEQGPLLGRLRTDAATAVVLPKDSPRAKSRSFPDVSSKAAGWWLIGAAGSVYAIVVLGGLTRLTESG